MDSETRERIVATLLLIGFELQFKNSIATSGTYYVDYDRGVSVYIFHRTQRIDIGERNNHVGGCASIITTGLSGKQLIARIVEEVEQWTVNLQEQRYPCWGSIRGIWIQMCSGTPIAKGISDSVAKTYAVSV